MSDSKPDQPDKKKFGEALEELQSIVRRLEQGDLELDESLKDFEKGVQLVRDCQEQLKSAEQKIQILTGENDGEGTPELQPFSHEEET